MPPEEANDAEAGLAAQRQAVIDRLDEEGRTDLSAPLEKCGLPRSLYCSNCGHEHIFQERCKRRYCPVCARMIAARFTLRYESTLARLKWPLFVTWTAQHSPLFPGPDFPTLFHGLQKMRDQVWWKKTVPGGIASGEVSYSGENGWHRHLHCVLDARWFSVTTPAPPWGASKQLIKRRGMAAQREIASIWELVIQHPGSMSCQRCDGAEAVREILKYAVTPATLLNSPDPIGPVIDDIRRQRLVRSWGTMYGHLRDNDAKIPRPPCPTCNQKAGLLHESTVSGMFRRGVCG